MSIPRPRRPPTPLSRCRRYRGVGPRRYQDVTFTTSGQGAEFISPTDGDQAAGTHFGWRMVPGAEACGLWVGTSPRTANLASLHVSNATWSYNVAALPVGQKLYARIWTKVNGAWSRYQDISFTAGAR